MARAGCRDRSLATELTSDDRGVALAAAKRVCRGCPVMAECRAYGADEAVGDHVVGIYGGSYLRVDGVALQRRLAGAA